MPSIAFADDLVDDLSMSSVDEQKVSKVSSLKGIVSFWYCCLYRTPKTRLMSFIEVLSLHCACPGIAREGNNKHVICCDCLKRHPSTWHALQLSSSLFTWSVPLSQQCNIHVSLILSWMMKQNDCQLTHHIITCENPQTNERMSCQRDFDRELNCEYLLNPMCDKESDLL